MTTDTLKPRNGARRAGPGSVAAGTLLPDVLQRTPLGPHLRKEVRSHPLFRTVTLEDVISSPFSLEDFLQQCRSLPQCGDRQITLLRQILRDCHEQRKAPGADGLLPFRGAFAQDFMLAVDSVYRSAWQSSHFAEFHYLPASVPEICKTRATLTAELGAGQDCQTYLGKLEGLRHSMRSMLHAKGTILLDSTTLRHVFRRQGVYSEMTSAETAEQFAEFSAMVRDLPAGVELRVIDFLPAGLSCGWVSRNSAVIAAMGGYVSIQDPKICDTLYSRCKAAASAGGELDEFLSQCAAGSRRSN